MTRAIHERIALIMSELDMLEDSAAAARLFELRQIANLAFFSLDGYCKERDLSIEAPARCESCDAGWHEDVIRRKGCSCACHRVASLAVAS